MNILNWKLGNRLAAGFFLVLTLLGLVSVTSWSSLSELRKMSGLITHQYYPLTIEANTLINGVYHNSLLTFRALVARTSDERNKYIQQITEQNKANSVHIQELKNQLTGDPQALKMLEAIDDARAKSKVIRHNVFALADSGQPDAAQALMSSQMDAQTADLIRQITDVIDYANNRMHSGEKDVESTYRTTLWLTTFIVLASLLAGGVIAWGLTRSVVKPMQEALKGIVASGQGDMTTAFREHYHRDETGRMLTGLKETTLNISHMLSRVRDGALSVSTASSQIAAGNQDLSSRTEEQASALAQTASSLEELTATVSSTADNAQQMKELVSEGTGIMHRSLDVMNATTVQMDGIHQASQKMSEIISLIEAIAFQTNILALNAAVEAARAEEAGRGFAVVGEEVRSLAQKSAVAARDIKELIESSVEQKGRGRHLITEANVVLRELTHNAEALGSLIGDVARASVEQSDGLRQINVTVTQLDTATQQNAALVQESASAAQSLSEQASVMTEMVNRFRLRPHQTASSYILAPIACKIIPPVDEKEAHWATF